MASPPRFEVLHSSATPHWLREADQFLKQTEAPSDTAAEGAGASEAKDVVPDAEKAVAPTDTNHEAPARVENRLPQTVLLRRDGEVAETLVGHLPPELLRFFAKQQTVLLSKDHKKLKVFVKGTKLLVGPHCVDISSFDVSEHTYVTEKFQTVSFTLFGDVARRHRLARSRFERR